MACPRLQARRRAGRRPERGHIAGGAAGHGRHAHARGLVAVRTTHAGLPSWRDADLPPPLAAAAFSIRPLNEDFTDLLAALVDTGARFIVVGAHAMAVHGVPRATGDIDVWIAPGPENAERVWKALLRFGAPVEALGLSRDDLARRDQVVQIGLPPRRIDVLTAVSGVEFDEAWPGRVTHRVGSLAIPFIGREALIRNKRASGRPKDLADLEALGEHLDEGPSAPRG